MKIKLEIDLGKIWKVCKKTLKNLLAKIKPLLFGFLLFLKSKWWQSFLVVLVFSALCFFIGITYAFFAIFYFFAIIFRFDERIPFAFSITLLLCCPIVLFFGLKQAADFLAQWIFFFLLIGLYLSIADLRNSKKEPTAEITPTKAVVENSSTSQKRKKSATKKKQVGEDDLTLKEAMILKTIGNKKNK